MHEIQKFVSNSCPRKFHVRIYSIISIIDILYSISLHRPKLFARTGIFSCNFSWIIRINKVSPQVIIYFLVWNNWNNFIQNFFWWKLFYSKINLDSQIFFFFFVLKSIIHWGCNCLIKTKFENNQFSFLQNIFNKYDNWFW